jgi:hypothetical protein
MMVKVRLTGNKLCENALEVCSETEAVPSKAMSEKNCDLQKVSHTDQGFRPNVTSKIIVK